MVLFSLEPLDSISKILDICGKSFRPYTFGHRAGLIRSDPYFPWQYDTGARTCSLTLSRLAGHHLHITVRHMDVSEEDSITLTCGESAACRHVLHENPRIGERVRADAVHDNADYTFTFNVSTYSKGGKGFIICFKCKSSPKY